MQLSLHIVGGLQAVVHVLLEESQAHASEHAQHHRHGQVERNARTVGLDGRLGRVDDRYVGGADGAHQLYFLAAAQQAFVDLASGVDLALLDLKVDGFLFVGRHHQALSAYLLGQLLLAVNGALKVTAHARQYAVFLLNDVG